MMNHSFSLLLLAMALALQGCATTLTKGSDRRTQGTYIDDGYIADTATDRIKNKYESKVHINVHSYNRKVLVTGEVPDEPTKTDITRIIGGVQNVTDIHNELSIAPGIRAEGNFQVDFAGVRSSVRAAEVGFFADYFFKTPRIMDTGKNANLFIGGTIAFIFGGKW